MLTSNLQAKSTFPWALLPTIKPSVWPHCTP